MAAESKRQSSWIIVGVIAVAIALFISIALFGGSSSRPAGDASSPRARVLQPLGALVDVVGAGTGVPGPSDPGR